MKILAADERRSTQIKKLCLIRVYLCLSVAYFLFAAALVAQSPISFSATTSNISGANVSIRIDVLRWSTDAERDQFLAAWTNPAASTTGGRGGRGRGAAVAAPDPAPVDADIVAGNDAPPPAAAGRGGRGG